MAHGFFTVEEWKRPRRGKAEWVAVLHVSAYENAADALAALGRRGKPGLYRVVQTQRIIWAQMEAGKLKLHGSHVGSTEDLTRMTQTFECTRGIRPVEEARQERAKIIAARKAAAATGAKR